MAKAVIHQLEVVQIDKQNRHLITVALRLCQRSLQGLKQHFPVGKIGQAVMNRLIFNFVFGSSAILYFSLQNLIGLEQLC